MMSSCGTKPSTLRNVRRLEYRSAPSKQTEPEVAGVDARHRLQQRRLARPAAADDCDQLTGRDAERRRVEQRELPAVLRPDRARQRVDVDAHAGLAVARNRRDGLPLVRHRQKHRTARCRARMRCSASGRCVRTNRPMRVIPRAGYRRLRPVVRGPVQRHLVARRHICPDVHSFVEPMEHTLDVLEQSVRARVPRLGAAGSRGRRSRGRAFRRRGLDGLTSSDRCPSPRSSR